MAPKTVTITGRMGYQNGQPVTDGTVSATLTGRDRDDDTIILPEKISANVQPDGSFSLSLWPNDLGTTGTRYSLVYRPQSPGAADQGFGNVPVFDAGPYTLGDLLEAVDLEALLGVTVHSLTLEEYEARLAAGTLQPNVLYMTRPA